MVEADNGRLADQIERIFEYWKLVMNHPRAQLDTKRGIAIRKILKSKYTEEDCQLAIEGCADSGFHQGDNQEGKVYDSIGLIFRDADHVDRFIELGTQLRRRVEKQAQAAITRASAPPPVPDKRGPMPENVRQRVRELLRRRVSDEESAK